MITNKVEFGIALSRARKNAGMTLTQAAKTAGIAVTAFGRYERGESEPAVTMAAKLAKAVDTSLGELMQAQAAMQMQNKELQQVMAIIQQWPKKKIVALGEVIKPS